MTRRAYALNAGRKAPSEAHGARISIKREEETEEGTRLVETHYVRGGPTVHSLDDYAFWWLDRYAEAFPGTTFQARMAQNGQVARVGLPADCTPIPLPESSKEYDDKQREEYFRQKKRADDRALAAQRRAMAESEHVLERLRETMGLD